VTRLVLVTGSRRPPTPPYLMARRAGTFRRLLRANPDAVLDAVGAERPRVAAGVGTAVEDGHGGTLTTAGGARFSLRC
jgi:hypothetical protein